jgi:hypothetical protein
MGYKHTVLEREMKGTSEPTFSLFKRSQSGLRKRISMVGSALVSQIFVLGYFLLLVLWNVLRMTTRPHSLISPGTFFLLGFFWLTIGFPVVILGRLAGSMVSLFLFLFLAFVSRKTKLKTKPTKISANDIEDP